MTIAYWCLLATIVLPYLWVAIARLPVLTLEKNLIPRIASESYSGKRQRTYWAHLNALEMVAPFTAAVITAHLLGAPQDRIDVLAMLFVGFRVAHALAYIANLGVLRTVMFTGGFICLVAIFIAGA